MNTVILHIEAGMRQDLAVKRQLVESDRARLESDRRRLAEMRVEVDEAERAVELLRSLAPLAPALKQRADLAEAARRRHQADADALHACVGERADRLLDQERQVADLEQGLRLLEGLRDGLRGVEEEVARA